MSKLIFSERVWEDYFYWKNQDKRTLKKINLIIKAVISRFKESLSGGFNFI